MEAPKCTSCNSFSDSDNITQNSLVPKSTSTNNPVRNAMEIDNDL